MNCLISIGWLCAVAFNDVTPPVATQASSGSVQTARNVLWQIGKLDHAASEFALAPDEFARFPYVFPDDPVFVVGRSNARSDWPFVHPGPVDMWTGSRRHTFTIVFGLKEAPRKGEGRLVIDLVDAHRSLPPKLEISVNGHASEHQTASGSSDTLEARPANGRDQHFAMTVPAAALKAGNNTITITSLTGSWFVYDTVTFEAPEGVEASAVEPETTILGVEAAPGLLKQDDGGRGQPVRLSVRHTGDRIEATVKVGGGKPVPIRLGPGNQKVGITAPAVDKPTSVSVTLLVDGKESAPQKVELKPARQWEIYLLPHSHNDIGYTDVQTAVERKQWSNLETAVETIRKTADYPAGSRFKWNVEVMWAVDSYLKQATPDKQKEFIDAVKAGSIELDALYANELTGLCRPEELFRLVECGGRVARRCGVPLESAMISDIPGYTWGIVPVLAQAGVKYFSVGPNHMDRIGGTLEAWGDKPFYWVSPSGQERVLCWVAGKGYAFFHRGTLEKMGEVPIYEYFQRLEESGYPYDLVQLRYTVGGDNGPPDPGMCDYVRQWNERYVSPRLVIATAGEACRELEKRYGDKLPQARGDFTPYWEDGAASTAHETAMNRAAAEQLVQTETLFAMLMPREWPVAEFDAAWRNVLLFDEHTWGAYNSVSEPDAQFVKDQWKIKQVFAVDGDTQSRKLLAAVVLEREPASGQVAAIDVLNTCSWIRSDLVALSKQIAFVGDAVKALDGEAVASQRLSTGELAFVAKDVPAFGVRRYLFFEGKASAQGSAKVGGSTLSNANVSVKIDEKTGAIASLRTAGSDVDWVDAKEAVALNDYRYMLGSDAAGAKGNGPVKITVVESGPLVAAVRIESDAPGCNTLIREVRVVDGLERVDITNTVDKKAVREKEGVHFGFAFNVPDGVMRMDIPWAVMRPEVDQLPGSCKNWFTVQRWVDISNAKCGVTWATVDAPLVEVGAMTADKIGSQTNPAAWISRLEPSQTLYSWVMNNHWHTNYKADQEGITRFQYSIQTHGAFDSAAAERFGIERSQPLHVRWATKSTPVPKPLLRVEPPEVLVTSLRPSRDGKAIMVRLFNASDRRAAATLTWGESGSRKVSISNPFEEPGPEASNTIDLPGWGVTSLRCEGP
jgi:alpha-mannosidase